MAWLHNDTNIATHTYRTAHNLSSKNYLEYNLKHIIVLRFAGGDLRSWLV